MKSKKLIACVTALITILGSSTIATTKVASAGELLKNGNFNNNIGVPWTVVNAYPAQANFEIKDGKYYVTVINDGNEGRWDVQFRYRNLVLKQGYIHTVKFTVTADKDCYIYPRIGDQASPFNEYWNYNSYQKIPLKAGIPTTINQNFTMNDPTTSAVEFAFHLAGDCRAASFPYTFTFDDISLSDNSSIVDPPPPIKIISAVRVNQVGYYTKLEKKATVVTKATSPIAWRLRNNAGTVVKTGETTVVGLDAASGDNVHTIDFSDYTIAGDGYTLEVDEANIDTSRCNNAVSSRFNIGTGLYSTLQVDAVKYFYLNRSGIPITMPYAENEAVTRPAGHPFDIVSPSVNDWYKDSYSIDATGGWYDYGDNGKYVKYGGIAAWTMMNQYERSLKAGTKDFAPFADNTMNIPESGNGYPDILDETRYEMEMLLKLQIPSVKTYGGMVHRKASDERWLSLALRPDEDPMKRYLQPPSTAATLELAATAAQASRLWRSYDQTFASKCIVAAETAWEAAVKNPNIYEPATSSISGPIQSYDVTDEFYWAAAELYETTGKQVYLDYLKNSKDYLKMQTETLDGSIADVFDCDNVARLGTITLALGNQLDDASRKIAKDNITVAADALIAIQNSEGYGTPMKQSKVSSTENGYPLTVTGYPLESNSIVLNEAMVISYAHEFTKNEKYLNGVASSMDYILGRNANVQSYVTGYGYNPVENPHHLFWAYQADNTFPKAPAGCLTSGPNSGLQDPWVRGMGLKASSTPAAKCFVDNIESWSTNEVSTQCNASLAWVASYMESNGNREIVLGDVNGDSKDNVVDLALMKKYVLGTVDGGNLEVMDVNGDGKFNAIDLALVKKYLLGEITKFPASK